MERVKIDRWPSEIPLLAFVIAASSFIWFALVFSIIGVFYAVFVGVFFFIAHLTFIAHLRGSAVKIGPEQFPELHRRVCELSTQAGLKEPPETYLMQAGGDLNALATKLFRSKLLVLYTDLIDACGDNTAARDMVIGHEIGHHRAGHLRFHWFLLPGMMVPFLGMALSRAREYTCDRWGATLCGDRQGALTGLAILAAGGSHGHRVNLKALARQRQDLATGWMTLGKWLTTHPPLAERIAALDHESAVDPGFNPARGPVRAVAIMLAVFVIPTFGLALVGSVFVNEMGDMLRTAHAQNQPLDGPVALAPPDDFDPDMAMSQALDDMLLLAVVVEDYREETGAFPEDTESLYEFLEQTDPEIPEPLDPFDGQRYGFAVEEEHFFLWSSGPDGRSPSDDDVVLDSRDLAD